MWYFGGCSALGDGWMVIYCMVEWVSECGQLGPLRIYSQCKTAPPPKKNKTSRPCAFFINYRSISVLSEPYETSYLFYVTLSFLCNIICYLISVFVFSLVTLSGAPTVLEMDNKWLYSCCLVWCYFQDSFNIARSSLVQLPSSVFSKIFVSFLVVHPYSSIDITIFTQRSGRIWHKVNF